MSVNQPSVVVFLGLGANLGDAKSALLNALRSIHRLPQTSLCKISSLYHSAPVDAQGPDYLNAVAKIETKLPALELLNHLQAIENVAGRQRPYRNAPRTLDIDILLYGTQSWQDERLTIPHARMYERAFVLLPLQEIAPELADPVFVKQTSTQTIEKVEPLLMEDIVKFE